MGERGSKMTRDKWWGKEMDYDQAKELVGQLKTLCEDGGPGALQIVLQSEREDYAEAIRVVMEYLP